ncbi:MAG: hypothetical protein NTY08_09385 [Proteobacteria bacterium]|nr:hypothetical protein [Pseudomonadota bacterium]
MRTINLKTESSHLRLCFATLALSSLFTACNIGGTAPAPAPKTKVPPVEIDPTESTSLDPEPPATENGSGSGGYLVSKDPECKRADECPPANPLLRPLTPSLTGIGGTKLIWQFEAYDQAQPKRRLAIIIKGLPDLATIDLPLTLGTVVNKITVTYLPSTALTGQLDIILRDFDRCIVSEAENAVCVSSTFNAAYDRQQPPVPFTIEGNPSSVKNCPKPAFFSTPPPGC